MKYAIRIQNLWKHYGQNGKGTTPALSGASMEVAEGEIILLLGKSGSGKSTLLNLIAGIDRPTAGTVEIDGEDIFELGEGGLTQLRRRHIGFVFQFFNLLPTLTVFENVFLALELVDRKDRRTVLDVLAAVGLEGKDRRYPFELSGGEQQRVAIARAIVKKPSIILADEPTGNLDNKTGEQILELLHGQCRESKTTLVMASHSAMTTRYADRVLRIVDGVVVEETDTREAGS
jgi:putative ABC transport system ATP-binding protein